LQLQWGTLTRQLFDSVWRVGSLLVTQWVRRCREIVRQYGLGSGLIQN
jgi:hypothetical protein